MDDNEKAGGCIKFKKGCMSTPLTVSAGTDLYQRLKVCIQREEITFNLMVKKPEVLSSSRLHLLLLTTVTWGHT